MCDRSRSSSSEWSVPLVSVLAVALTAAVAPGCGGGNGVPSVPPPTVIVGPSDADVFEGQQALFQVLAAGRNGVTYLWRRDGVAIPGAFDSHFQTAPTTPSDDGAVFSVVVTNGGAASVESAGALLTVRPPLDLRFKWVGSPRQLTWVQFGNMLPSGWSSYSGATGTPLMVGSGICGDILGCSWFYGVAVSLGMDVKYEAGPIEGLRDAWTALPPRSIVSSLDLEEAGGAYAMASMGSTQVGEFTPLDTGSVPLDDLQAVAESEGALGHILTAVSFSGGLVTYVAHGWTRNGGMTYEAQVVASTFETVVADASALASQGYVITVFGAGDEAVNGLVLVGTRPHGSTTPRTITTTNAIPWEAAGVGIVAGYVDAASPAIGWIAEQ